MGDKANEEPGFPERKSKRESNTVTQAKAHGNAPANLPGVPLDITGETTALTWF